MVERSVFLKFHHQNDYKRGTSYFKLSVEVLTKNLPIGIEILRIVKISSPVYPNKIHSILKIKFTFSPGFTFLIKPNFDSQLKQSMNLFAVHK